MKFILPSTVLLGAISVLLLLRPAPASASTDCYSSCGDANTWCVKKAGDRLLGSFGCLRQPDLTFLYPGGRTAAHVPGTPCKAVFSTPANLEIYVTCSELRGRLNRVKSKCFSPAGSGYGRGIDVDIANSPDRYAAITACEHKARPRPPR